MREYLKEVARGPRGSKDLTYEEMRKVATMMVTGEATDAQVTAFLVAERMKGETTDEIRAFADILRQQCPRLQDMADTDTADMSDMGNMAENDTLEGPTLDCAGPYDGRRHSFLATIPVAAILAASGIRVCLHSSDSLPPKLGTTPKQVLRLLGIQALGDLAEIRKSIKERGFSLIDPEAVCDPLRRLRGIRMDIGVRTLINTAEKLLNLSSADYLITGVFHKTALEKVSGILAHSNFKRACVVQGLDGSEDVSTDGPFLCQLIQNGSSSRHVIEPRNLGLYQPNPPVNLSASEQAKEVEQVLTNQSPRFRNMVLLNSGLRLWVTDQVKSIHEGVQVSQEVLNCGAAWAKFQSWRTDLPLMPGTN